MSGLREGVSPAWSSRPWAARFLRGTVVVAPLLASVVFVWLVSRWLPAPRGSVVEYALWWLALSAVGSVVLVVADRAARRLLPLAALLRLSLVFPDEAPSRFRAALEAGRVRRLEDRLELMREAREAGTARESAQRLLTLVAALSEHDSITRGHSERVRAYSVLIGEELRLDKDELDLLNWAALLHDVGKLDVAGEILRKPGRPTDDEWQQIRQHPLYGERLVEPMRAWLGGWTDAVGYHHERWDGQGYPRGVGSDEIPLAGRIVAIADVFDVITSARSYKEPGSPAAGREEIARYAGTQFDPTLVRAFLGVSLGRMRLVMGPLSWLAHTPILGRLPLAPAAGTVWSTIGVVVAATGLAGSVGATSHADARQVAAVVRPAAAPQAGPGAATGEHRRGPVRASTESVSLPAAADPPLVGSPPVASPPRESTPAPSHPDDPAPSPNGPADPSTPAPDDPGANAPAPVLPAQPAPNPAPLPVPTLTVNDPPSFSAGSDQSLLEDGGARSVAGWATNISAGPASDSGQSVTFSASNDNVALFSAQPAVQANGTLSYTPAVNASGMATVTVRAVDNGGTANGGNDTSAPQTFTITVTDVNDAPSITPGANQSLLEDAGARSVPGWATGISAGPADESSQSVAFSVNNDNLGLFSAQPQVLADGTLAYTANANASGTANVTVNAIDDGGSANGGSDTSAPVTFTINVASVNDAPSFTAGANQTVLVNSAQQTLTGWATGISTGPPDESGQSLSFSVSNDNPGLFSAQPQVQSNGTLTYTPAAGATGAATVTVRAVDGGGVANGGSDTSAPQTFTITVADVNNAPSFTAGSNEDVLEDDGAQSVSGWATGISPGPPNESGQSVTFSVSNDNTSMFSSQPAVQPNGRLTYTPAPNANGTATVTVRAVDDGGTAFGGSDTSAPQTFTITVDPVNDPPSFTAGGNQLVLVNSSQQTIPAWATGISPGPPNESGQSVTFDVSNDNSSLFSVPPQVQPDGSLTYTPALLALGVANVTVQAHDNGGNSHSGHDTSPSQTFTITVIL